MIVAVAGLARAQAGPLGATPPEAPPPTMLGERAIVVIPEAKANNAWLRPIIEAHGYPVVVETPISGAMLVRVPRGLEESTGALFRGMMGVRSAGQERLTRGAGFECSNTPVMSSPFNFPGPSAGMDEDFGSQWYLENTGQVIVNDSCAPDPLNTVPGVPGIDINVRKAWAITQGCEDIVVAVLDTGVQYENPAFDPARFFFPDLAATCPDAVPTDPWSCCWDDVPLPYTPASCAFGSAIDVGGHGTPVAAVVGAQGNNDSNSTDAVEMAGVDLKCKILAGRVSIVDAFGTFPLNYFSEYATLYCLETIASDATYENVRVIHMSYSYGCNVVTSPVYDLLSDACDVLQSQDRFVVTLAGNYETYADRCPSVWDSVITVGGIDNIGNRWDARGLENCLQQVSAAGQSVDFCAPARAIHSAPCNPLYGSSASAPPESPCSGNVVYFASGTSGAAPQVAGIISLLLARADELGVELTWQNVVDLLRLGARRLSHWPGSERDDVFGWGLVDAYQSLMELELLYYRPFNRADLTDHATPGQWRFGVADGSVDCDDREFFLTHSFPNGIVDKADFTTAGTAIGQTGYGVPDGLVTPHDSAYYLNVLFPAAYQGSCSP